MEEGKWKIVDRTNLPSSIFHLPSPKREREFYETLLLIYSINANSLKPAQKTSQSAYNST